MAFVPDAKGPAPTGRFVPDEPAGFTPPGSGQRTRTPIPGTPAEAAKRARLEAELADAQAGSAAAEGDINFWEGARGILQGVTRAARGVVSPASLVVGAANAITGKELLDPNFGLAPPELAPRNDNEVLADKMGVGAGAVLSGVGVGEALAGASGPVVSAVGRGLSDLPLRQLVGGAVTGPVVSEDARRAGLGPLGELGGELLGAGGAFVGSHPAAPAGPVLGRQGPAAAGPTVERMRSYGYPVLPEQAAALAQRDAPLGTYPGVPNEYAETFVNRGPLRERATIDAAKNTERLVRDDFGIPDGVPIPPALEQLAAQANGAYDVVARALPTLRHTPELAARLDSLGESTRANPYLKDLPGIDLLREQLARIEQAPTQQALDAIRQWRRDARIMFQSVDNPAKHELAKVYRQAADTLEQGIADQVSATGNAPLIDQFQAARTLQAKIHNVLDAWHGNELDPQALARLGQDVNLTGNLASIADAATTMPVTVQSSVGSTVQRPSVAGQIVDPISGWRRMMFDRWLIPKILSDAWQGKYGTIAGRSPALPYAVVGPLGNPDVGPRQPPPPPGGRFPRELAGEGPPELAPEGGGGAPFSSTPIPPQTGAADALGGIFDTNLFRGADTSAADAFPYDLARAVDESPPPPAMPGYGHPELPVDPYSINPDQLRPNVPVGGALQPGASPTGMAVIPEGPMEILPPPPDVSPFELAPEPRPRGPDTIDFTPDQPAPPDLAAGFDLAGQGSGLDFAPSDIQLGGRGRVLNTARRNLPRAGGRKTDAGDLRLETPPAGPDEFPMLPAPPPPAPLVARGPYVGRPQDFTDLGMTPGTARASSPRGEILGPDEGPATTGMKDVTPPRSAEEIGEPTGLTEGLEGEPPIRQVAPPNSLSASDEAMFDDALRALDRIETERNATAAQTAREKGEAGPRAVGEERGEPAGLAEAMEGEKPELTLEDAPERAAPVTPDYEIPVNPADHPAPDNLPKGRATTITLYRGVSDANRAGNAKGAVNYTPDSRVAARYGDVTERQVAFKNRLDAPTLSKLHESIGLPENATRDQLYERLKSLGYDGARYTLPDGEVEYIHFPSAD